MWREREKVDKQKTSWDALIAVHNCIQQWTHYTLYMEMDNMTAAPKVKPRPHNCPLVADHAITMLVDGTWEYTLKWLIV